MRQYSLRASLVVIAIVAGMCGFFAHRRSVARRIERDKQLRYDAYLEAFRGEQFKEAFRIALAGAERYPDDELFILGMRQAKAMRRGPTPRDCSFWIERQWEYRGTIIDPDKHPESWLE
jgi:hypothetical protein